MNTEDKLKTFRNWLFEVNASEFETYFNNEAAKQYISVDDYAESCSMRLGPFEPMGRYGTLTSSMHGLIHLLNEMTVKFGRPPTLRQFFMKCFIDEISKDMMVNPQFAIECMNHFVKLSEIRFTPSPEYVQLNDGTSWIDSSSRKRPTRSGQYFVQLGLLGKHYPQFEPLRLAKYDVVKGEWDVPIYYDDFEFSDGKDRVIIAWRELPKGLD